MSFAIRVTQFRVTFPEEPNTLWSAADRGDTEKVRSLIFDKGKDVNARKAYSQVLYIIQAMLGEHAFA